MKSWQRIFLSSISVIMLITVTGIQLTPTRITRGIVTQDPSAQVSPPGFLKFTAQNHILGFGAKEWFVSNGMYDLRVTFPGANRVTPIPPSSPAHLPGVDEFSKITYENLWEGINLTYRAVPDGIVESLYEIAPHADVNAIHLRYNTPLTLNPDSSLTATFETGQITESAPIAWQERNGRRDPVEIQFNQIRDSEIGFALGDYNPDLTLYVDPVLIWNTFLGGASYDEGDDIIVDTDGNIYVTGYSDLSWGNPIRPFSRTPDAFVAKLDSSGNLEWNTFLGGNNSDVGYGIALDANGNLYVAGESTSTWGNPVRGYTASINDAFLARMDTNGNLIWNTFLGGTGIDEAREVVSGGGNVFVTGRSDGTWGTQNPRPYTASMDGFVASVDTTGNLLWDSFLGGNGFDEAYGLAVDKNGFLYVTGISSVTPTSTGSWGTPIRAFTAFQDAFLTKLDSSGKLLWNTFLGGDGGDGGVNVAVDRSGNTYVAGYSTTTWGNPIRAFMSADDAFAAKVDMSGVLRWNTFLGGGGADQATSIDVDRNGNVYVTGYSSGDWGNPIRAFMVGNDGFAAEMEPDGKLLWNTFLGGNNQDYGYGIDVDESGTAYVIGTGNTTWGDPVHPYTADMDAFVVKLSSPPLVTSTSLTTVMNLGPSSFMVTFNKELNNPAGNTGSDDATNSNNYFLIDKDPNALADTTSCVGGIGGDDKQVLVTNVTYNPTTSISTITLANALPAGHYRLLVCGTTSIVDLSHTALAGDGATPGTDYVFDFTVSASITPPASPIKKIPSTGFAPGVISSLPVQTLDKAYTNVGSILLEIPSQKLKFNIVGVSQTKSGWDVTWLGNDVGWLNGTAFPSWEGNSVLTAHVYNSNGLPGPFLKIKDLKYRDQIIIDLGGDQYIFEVRQTLLVKPSDARFAFEHLEKHSYLTLITCEGYNEQSDSYRFRRVVRAVLISVK